jgi:5-methylcytosine-specific restriction endonuclease McrA
VHSVREIFNNELLLYKGWHNAKSSNGGVLFEALCSRGDGYSAIYPSHENGDAVMGKVTATTREHRCKYYAEHREQFKVYNKRCYAKNRDKNVEYARQYRDKNREEIRARDRIRNRARAESAREYMKEWREKNKQKIKELNHSWRVKNRTYANEKHREWKNKNLAKVKEWSARDYATHKEKRQAKHKEYRQNNKEKLNEIHREWRKNSGAHKKWRAENKARIASYRRNCYQRYRETYREFQNNYHARSPRRLAIYRKYDLCGELCYICGLHLDIEEMHIDHVHPIAKNGGNDIQNLMPAHAKCNIRKGKKADYPIARPDLVELAKCIQQVPRMKRKTKTPEYA